MIVKNLKSIGVVNIFQASDGMEGINEMALQKPNLVLCDISMKPGSGFDFLKHIRRLPEPESKTPVIFLTSSADLEAVTRAKDLRVDGYLLKPVKIDSLKEKITQVFFE